MSHNSFGHLFRVTTWGESHGPALGCVIDGCPPGIRLNPANITLKLSFRETTRRCGEPVAARAHAPYAPP